MLYHASATPNISILEPRISNHGIPLLYFSKKRENVLVYLSNAIEKYCRETGFRYHGTWKKWGPYGFNKDGTQRIEEYYPDALIKAYQGVSGYIYYTDDVDDSGFRTNSPDAVTSSKPVPVKCVEFVSDAFEAILQADAAGLISILRYEEQTEQMREWNRRTIRQEYREAVDHPEYRHFLLGNFADLIEGMVD